MCGVCIMNKAGSVYETNLNLQLHKMTDVFYTANIAVHEKVKEGTSEYTEFY